MKRHGPAQAGIRPTKTTPNVYELETVSSSIRTRGNPLVYQKQLAELNRLLGKDIKINTLDTDSLVESINNIRPWWETKVSSATEKKYKERLTRAREKLLAAVKSQ